VYALMPKRGNLHGIFVGDHAMFVEMNKTIEAHAIRPVVDRVFAFDDTLDAYRYHASGNFVGKVVIRM
jgi:NADPH:quinone reductase-like Zn-dependent oxidoreductase